MKLSVAASALLTASSASSSSARAASSSHLRGPRFLSTAIGCPPVDASAVVAPDVNGDLSLNVPTDADGLCTLVRVATSEGREYLTPIGRSYSGRGWEGVAPLGTSFDCGAEGGGGGGGASCSASLPPADAGEEYRLTTFSHVLTPEQEASRLRIQSTFGPTLSDIVTHSSSYANPASFVRSQMDEPPTFHRSYYRSNAQARTVDPSYIGRRRNPCEAGSRWRKFVFTYEDVNQMLTVDDGIDGKYLVSVNGQPRTQMVDPLPVPFVPGYSGQVCGWPGSGIGSFFRARYDGHGDCAPSGTNPTLTFVDDPYDLFPNSSSTILLELDGSTELRNAGSYGEQGVDEVLVHLDEIPDDENGRCSIQAVDGKTDVFGRTQDGSWWIFDPVLVLADATPEAVTRDDPGALATEASDVSLCSSVTRSYANDDSCFLYRRNNPHGRNSTCAGEREIVCPGRENEVANDILSNKSFDVLMDGALDSTWGPIHDFEHQKWTVWLNVALRGTDQLRQRVAWALYQIQVMAGNLLDHETEAYLSFYDIFVRHAFGNFKDVLREISYHPLMGSSLSYEGSASLQASGNYPDENYAREIMQLFTIGLWQLNPDGTRKLDVNGDPIPTYDTDIIRDMARAWTGLVNRRQRGNVENWHSSGNRIDPMDIADGRRDHFPKKSVNGGYIGDGVPLCSDLPPKPWLRKGAVYRLLGRSMDVDMLPRDDVWGNGRGGVNAYVNVSVDEDLHSAICSGDGGAGGTTTTCLNEGSCASSAECCSGSCLGDGTCLPGSSCAHPPTVTLQSNLPPEGSSTVHSVDSIRVVRLSDDVYYEYLGPPCVDLPFSDDVKSVKFGLNGEENMCMRTDSNVGSGSSSCCGTGTKETTAWPAMCAYAGERVTYGTHVSNCDAMSGKYLCKDIARVTLVTEADEAGCLDFNIWHWTKTDCAIDAKVTPEGKVAIVHVPGADVTKGPVTAEYREDTKNYFSVDWDGGSFPSPENGCGDGACSLGADNSTCLCRTTEVTAPVFEATFFDSQPSDLGSVVSSLTIGSFDPGTYDEGVYAPTVTWMDGSYAIDVWTHANGSPEDIILVVTDRASGKTGRYANKRSAVTIVHDGTGLPTTYGFRNPPKFGPSRRDAHHETELVLDSYVEHPNAAPFMATRLIQRFGLSNPPPSYVERVAAAFRSGHYGQDSLDFGSGEYGDLEATVAAILLDPEARSAVLDADPTSGSIREPLLRVLHFFRSMEYEPNGGYDRTLVIFENMDAEIGQMAHGHESVFSFFLAEYAAPGPVSSAGLVSPEAFMFDTPNIVGLMKGLFSLVKFGLTNCDGGFGHGKSNCHLYSEGDYAGTNGRLHFSPSGASPEEMLNELDLLLTGGRLGGGGEGRARILAALQDPAIVTDEQRLRLAQQLVVASPEFHVTGLVDLDDARARGAAASGGEASAQYRAIVYVLMGGGADTYNLLVPHSGCADDDMYAEYASVREGIAIPKESLLPIDATGSGQVCDTFGVHPNLPFLRDLYDRGDASFLANTGVLHRPTTKANYRDHFKKTRLFSHGQQRDVQEVAPDGDLFDSGVLGRISDVLTANGLLTARTTTGAGGAAGAIVINSNPQVSPPASYLSGSFGPTPFDPTPSISNMRETIDGLNNATTLKSSAFGETWSAALTKSLDDNDQFHEWLHTVELGASFPSTGLGNDLRLVARMAKVRAERKVERDIFAVGIGGFDSHRDLTESHDALYADIDAALASFEEEMQSQGLWQNVAVVFASEFGRTLSPNGGGGTDHAWGGNYFVAGGSVRGGQIHGWYPPGLTDTDPLILDRGRTIPTTGWDAVWNGVAGWFGVDDEQDLERVVPNRGNMPYLLTKEDMFDEIATTTSTTTTTTVPTTTTTPQGTLITTEVTFDNLRNTASGASKFNGWAESDSRVTVGRYFEGTDHVISIAIDGLDLDGGGAQDDSLSWKVRVQGMTNTIFQMCSGFCATVSGGNPGAQIVKEGNLGWGVNNARIGRDGESIVFKVEDVQLTADPGFTARFEGFRGIWLTTGSYIFGTGVNVEGRVVSSNSNQAINPPLDPLRVTVGVLSQERNRDLDGTFVISGYRV